MRILMQGLTGPIKVDGVEYALEMPALPTLTDDDIADVLTYVRREWDHAADPVDPDAVHEARQATKGHPGAWSSAELNNIE
jgi:mono/diheme cytochrome c family protein